MFFDVLAHVLVLSFWFFFVCFSCRYDFFTLFWAGGAMICVCYDTVWLCVDFFLAVTLVFYLRSMQLTLLIILWAMVISCLLDGRKLISKLYIHTCLFCGVMFVQVTWYIGWRDLCSFSFIVFPCQITFIVVEIYAMKFLAYWILFWCVLMMCGLVIWCCWWENNLLSMYSYAIVCWT